MHCVWPFALPWAIFAKTSVKKVNLMPPRLIVTIATITSLTAAPALADITPDDAWNIWQAQAKALGLTLEADEARDGEALQIGEITISATLPMDFASFSLSFPGPRFSPDGNGAVNVSLPDKMQASFSASITGEGSFDATFLIAQINENVVMSGTPDVVTSRWTSDGFNLHLNGLSYDKADFEDFTVAMEAGPYQTDITTSIGDTLAIDFTTENDSYALTYDYTIGAGDDAIGESGSDTATGISSEYSLVLPLDGLEFMQLHNQLRNTLSLSYNGNLQTYQSKQISTLGGTVITSITQAVADYHTALSLDHSGLGVEGTTGPVVADVVIREGESEMALTFLAASIEGELVFPLLKSDNPQDTHYLMDLQGIRFNPEFWQIIDPEGTLDRAPMSLRMDMGGTVDILVDLLDFAVLMLVKDSSEVILPSSFNLDTFSVSSFGSELSASSAFTFDKSDMDTYDGIPRPDGSFEFQLQGGNALLDQLAAAGLLPEEQVLGIRMVLSLIGQPGEGEDSLTSKIEMTPEGHIIANGQRLK